MNLQDRLERTLKDMTGIKNAIVTLNVPDESAYVWEDEDSGSTGSVSLTLMPSYDLSPEKVSAIKNLVNKEDGRTIVMVTHNEEQAKQTSRTIRFFDGRQVQ